MSAELETWAVQMAARNDNPLEWIAPVLLYRDGEPALIGASAPFEHGERVFTAAHGFSIDYPPFIWTYRRLIPSGSPTQRISKVVPLRGQQDDVAICTPASVLELTDCPLPNFYCGHRRGMGTLTDWQVVSRFKRTARSVLTGESVSLLAEIRFEGRVHVLLDYISREGESGSVFVSEEEKCMYILRAYSTTFVDFVRRLDPKLARSVKKGTTFALRLRYE